jgi:hypothetical protein
MPFFLFFHLPPSLPSPPLPSTLHHPPSSLHHPPFATHPLPPPSTLTLCSPSTLHPPSTLPSPLPPPPSPLPPLPPSYLPSPPCRSRSDLQVQNFRKSPEGLLPGV